MKRSVSKIVLCSLLTCMASSCADPDKFSEVPYLEYRGYEYVTDEEDRQYIQLKLYFTDGDGDIGVNVNPDDPRPPCDRSLNNIFIKYFEKVSGQYIDIIPPDSCLPFEFILPNLTSSGSNKTLEGEIIQAFDYFVYPENNNVDSIKFEVKIKDRAGHESNIVTSKPIPAPSS